MVVVTVEVLPEEAMAGAMEDMPEEVMVVLQGVEREVSQEEIFRQCRAVLIQEVRSRWNHHDTHRIRKR